MHVSGADPARIADHAVKLVGACSHCCQHVQVQLADAASFLDALLQAHAVRIQAPGAAAHLARSMPCSDLSPCKRHEALHAGATLPRLALHQKQTAET